MLRTSLPLASVAAVPIVGLLLALPAGPVAAQDPAGDRVSPPSIPLHLAALQGNVDAVRHHVAAGSDLDQRDAFGATPLIVATTFGRTAVARTLVDGGADLSIRNPEGSTPLHIAAFLGRRAIVELLLRHGADPDLRDDDGASPYDLAAQPVDVDRPVIDQLRAALGPFGLEVDHDGIAAARSLIVELLRRPEGALPEVDFRPRAGGGWPVSSPSAEGLDPAIVARLYADASGLESIRGLVIVKGGRLVAEKYFNDGAVGRPTLVQSVTKSVTSALVGIALERGCLHSLDQRMIDFFPERAGELHDPRKREITIRQMLRMRAGYGYEPGDSVRWEGLIGDDYLPLLVEFSLDRDPGTGFDYSNLTSHLLGVIVARACDVDLMEFAERHLFDPIGVDPGEWTIDGDGYRYGYGGLHLTARDMARFGLLYLNDGVWEGRQVVPAGWVEASLTGYSSTLGSPMLPTGAIGRYFRDAEYGYQWWSADVAGRRVDFAWGYGGQLIVLLHELDMVLVVTSDPFLSTRRVYEARQAEPANFNIVGKFIQSLPDSGGEA